MICPICKFNRQKLITYHISYNPERTIYACKWCNYIEYLDRSGDLNKIINKIHDLRDDNFTRWKTGLRKILLGY